MRTLKKKYFFIIPIILILISIIGFCSHQEQKLEGTFYLVVLDEENRTKTISDDFIIEIDGKQAIIQDNGKIEQQKIDEEEKSFYISGNKYFYNYNTGHLNLTRKINDSEFDSLELVSDASPMFESYKKGKVSY